MWGEFIDAGSILIRKVSKSYYWQEQEESKAKENKTMSIFYYLLNSKADPYFK